MVFSPAPDSAAVFFAVAVFAAVDDFAAAVLFAVVDAVRLVVELDRVDFLAGAVCAVVSAAVLESFSSVGTSSPFGESGGGPPMPWRHQ